MLMPAMMTTVIARKRKLWQVGVDARTHWLPRFPPLITTTRYGQDTAMNLTTPSQHAPKVIFYDSL